MKTDLKKVNELLGGFIDEFLDLIGPEPDSDDREALIVTSMAELLSIVPPQSYQLIVNTAIRVRKDKVAQVNANFAINDAIDEALKGGSDVQED